LALFYISISFPGKTGGGGLGLAGGADPDRGRWGQVAGFG
jgi:hypothetical protein